MRTHAKKIMLAAALLPGLAACDLAPLYTPPPAPIPVRLPYTPDTPGRLDQAVILDPRLMKLTDRALSGNRDLRIALEAAATDRARYRAQRSAEVPTLSASASGVALPVGSDASIATPSVYATVGVNSFEIDIFSRLKNLSRAAFAAYLASDEGVAEARLTVRSSVAQAFVDLAADKALLNVARQTASAGAEASAITVQRSAAGLASGSDVQNAIIILQQARSDEQEQSTRVEQDRDALRYLVGGPVALDEEPVSLDGLDGAIVAISSSTSSVALLRRPDVRQAERLLQAAGFRIGAARAAFFPTITLSSAAGFAGVMLSNLFTGGAISAIIAPTASVPIFGGPQKAYLAQTRSERAEALDAYEKVLQAGFRDAADGLAREATIGEERADQAKVTIAAAEAYRLSLLRFKAGEGDFLAALVDQQALYRAQRRQIALADIDLRNRITLAASLARL